MQAVKTIGLDIAKSVFQVHGVDADGQVVIRRKLKRRYIAAYSALIITTRNSRRRCVNKLAKKYTFLASSTLPLTRLQLLRSLGGNLDLPVRATRKACWLVGRRRNTPAGSSALSERRAGCRRRS